MCVCVFKVKNCYRRGDETKNKIEITFWLCFFFVTRMKWVKYKRDENTSRKGLKSLVAAPHNALLISSANF